jgi:site-specific recombinase XerD
MLEELERRNYAPGTIRCYIRTVEHFSRHFRRSPDQLGPEHIRRYQALMFHKWKLAPNTVSPRLAALRFFYIQVLKRNWSIAETPYPKKVLHLPQVLSQQEVARLIDAALTPFPSHPAHDPLCHWWPARGGGVCRLHPATRACFPRSAEQATDL